MYRLFMYRLLFVSLVTALAGCATSGERPIPLLLTVTIAHDANPDNTGRPSPVVLDVFELTHDRHFRNADYLALLADPASTLRNDMLYTRRIMAIAPGRQRDLRLAIDGEANHIGIVAEVAQFSGIRTRVAFPLKSYRKNVLNLIVDAKGIRVADGEKPAISMRSRFNDD